VHKPTLCVNKKLHHKAEKIEVSVVAVTSSNTWVTFAYKLLLGVKISTYQLQCESKNSPWCVRKVYFWKLEKL